MRTTLLTLALAVLATTLSAQQSVDRQTALQKLGLPGTFAGDLETSSHRFKTLGVTVTSVKAVDPATGEVVTAAWDDDGRTVTLSDVRRREIAVRKQTPAAKLHWKLERALATDGQTTHPIMIWMDFPAAEWDRRVNEILGRFDESAMSREDQEALEEEAGAFINREVQRLTAAFATELMGAGVEVRFASTGTPVIAANANLTQIMMIASLNRTDTIYLDSDDKTEHLADAHETHRTSKAHERGVTGRDADIAILENNRIDENHPWLTNCVDWFDLAGSGPDDHVQATAGCAASQLESRIGAAPGADLYSANAASYSDANVTLAADWITGVVGTVDITNGSFGPDVPSGNLDYSDRLFDYKSRFFADSYVMSAGNSGIGNLVGNVGWNIIAVGANSGADDRGNWDDDVMSTFSSTGNPTTGCEKPNVSAVGQDLETLGDGSLAIIASGCPHTQPAQWLINNYCGTSFSSPLVAGNLANALQVDSTMSTPEPAMALLMATAWHNIEGSSRLSDQDGAGCIHGWALVNAARESRAVSVTLNTTSFSTNGYYTYNVFLQGGDKARVCIAWASNADSGYTTDVLDADLDLAVFTGQSMTSGTSHGFSSSFNNNFEIVEFVPPSTGWYTVRINDFRFDGTSERCGIAWSQKTRDTSTARLMERNLSNENPLRMGPVPGNRYWLDINAPHSPATTWLTAPGTVGYGGTVLGSESWSPVVIDLFTLLWFDNLTLGTYPWKDFVGVTNSNGYGHTNRLDPIWALPSLAGWDITHIGYLIDPAYPNTIREITEPQTMEFLPQATAIPAGLDTTHEVIMPFTFTFFGTGYTSLWVNSNGNVTFGSGDTDFSESEAELLADQPRIALFWDDLGFNQAGTLTTREVTYGEDSVIIDYVEVTEYTLANQNTGRITLYQDGRIRLQWRECDLVDCIAGISPGNGVSANTSRDLTDHGYATIFGAIFEVFNASNPFDLGHPGIPSFGGEWHNDMTFIPSGGSYRIEMNVDR